MFRNIVLPLICIVIRKVEVPVCRLPISAPCYLGVHIVAQIKAASPLSPRTCTAQQIERAAGVEVRRISIISSRRIFPLRQCSHLAELLRPVLNSFSDQDARVRYYGCEALYNIAKVARAACVLHFNDIFDGLFKLSADTDTQVQSGMQLLDRLMKDIVTEADNYDIDAFMPLLGERIYVTNPFSRQFLVGWVATLDSVPDIEMLQHLPVFFDGLFHMLADQHKEIRSQTFSVRHACAAAAAAGAAVLRHRHCAPPRRGAVLVVLCAWCTMRALRRVHRAPCLRLLSPPPRLRASQVLQEFLREIRDADTINYAPIVHVLVQHSSSQDKFSRLTAVTWIHTLISHGREKLLPFAAKVGATVAVPAGGAAGGAMGQRAEPHASARNAHSRPAAHCRRALPPHSRLFLCGARRRRRSHRGPRPHTLPRYRAPCGWLAGARLRSLVTVTFRGRDSRRLLARR